MVTIKIKTVPDALVRLYQETPTEEVIYLDTTDENGETAPIALAPAATYYCDITPYPPTNNL